MCNLHARTHTNYTTNFVSKTLYYYRLQTKGDVAKEGGRQVSSYRSSYI